VDELFFHPKVVHVPIALAVLMPLIAAGALLAWWRDWMSRRVWIGVVVLQAILVGSAFVALRTGEAEEDAVEKIVAEDAIHEHEEAAEWFLWASAIVLALIAAAAVLPNARVALGLALLGTLGTLLVFAAGYRTGHLGGELVYRHGAAKAYETPPLGP
jgi:uncharacterized membrane protein